MTQISAAKMIFWVRLRPPSGNPGTVSNTLRTEEDSPYPEVRSAVANFDDPDMPASTVRAWVIGTLWAVILPALNQFFYFRYPTIEIGAVSS